jgi:hypothetical protein
MQQINLKTISGSSPILDLSNYASFGQTQTGVGNNLIKPRALGNQRERHITPMRNNKCRR